jgi:hypothetical protein
MSTIALQHPSAHVRPWVRRLVRLGYAAKGVIYLLIGFLALQVALGDGGRITDKDGVLTYVLGLPFGTPLLAMIGVGLLAYAFWEITGAFLDPVRHRDGPTVWLSRGLDVVKGAIYGGVGWQALRIVMGAGQQKSRGAEGYASDAMQFPLGAWAVALIGVGVVIYAMHEVWLAWQSRFEDDMDQQHLRREGLGWVLDVGRAGIGARGVVLAIMGVLLTRAGLDRRPSEAGGIADALTTLIAQPFGAVLLGAIAAGLVCYGAWQVLHARYARI